MVKNSEKSGEIQQVKKTKTRDENTKINGNQRSEGSEKNGKWQKTQVTKRKVEGLEGKFVFYGKYKTEKKSGNGEVGKSEKEN